MLHDEPIRLARTTARPATFIMTRSDARRQFQLSLALVGLLGLATIVAGVQTALAVLH